MSDQQELDLAWRELSSEHAGDASVDILVPSVTLAMGAWLSIHGQSAADRAAPRFATLQ